MSERRTTEQEWTELKRTLAVIFEPPLLRLADALDRGLRRWPWLYRKLGGTA